MDQKRHSGVGTGEVVPFGKYKGQPVEALAADPTYLDWLTAQPWFRDRFASLYTIVINNFREPDETPEHNAMQVRFLDPAYVAKVVAMFIDRFSDGFRFSILPEPARFEVRGVDVAIRFGAQSLLDVVQGSNREGDEFGVELKPSMADDYPAVLRQIIAQRHTRLLIVGRYDGRGATWDQVVATFKASGVAVLYESDLHFVDDDHLDGLRNEVYSEAFAFSKEYRWSELASLKSELLEAFNDQCFRTGHWLCRKRDFATAEAHVQAFRRGISLVRTAINERREEQREFDSKFSKTLLGDWP